MGYVISIDDNTYNMVDYLHDLSADFSLFSEGVSLRGLNLNLIYKAKNKSSFNKLKNLHVISTTGPELVSRELRSVLEVIAPTDVEFFDAKIIYKDEQLDGFSAINPIIKENCCDMVNSEYQLTNFDPNNPIYMFLYTVLLDEIPYDLNIVRCGEQPNFIVVSDKVKTAIFNAGLKGVRFCKSLDMTYNNRTSCETS